MQKIFYFSYHKHRIHQKHQVLESFGKKKKKKIEFFTCQFSEKTKKKKKKNGAKWFESKEYMTCCPLYSRYT